MIELTMDALADELGMDRLELRRKNFITEFPYELPHGFIYDSGNYDGTLDRCLEKLDLDAFRREQEELRSRGIYRGNNGTKYFYAHLSGWEGSNRSVSQGETIGYIGATGKPRRQPPPLRDPPRRGRSREPLPGGSRRLLTRWRSAGTNDPCHNRDDEDRGGLRPRRRRLRPWGVHAGGRRTRPGRHRGQPRRPVGARKAGQQRRRRRLHRGLLLLARIEPMERFTRTSPAAAIAGVLMGAATVRLYHDHVLVKEAGTRQRTPWHQDLPYYNVDGRQNVSMWCPVDPVPRSATLELVAGSHRGPWYLPRTFLDGAARWFPAGSLAELPDVDAGPAGRGARLVTGTGRRSVLPHAHRPRRPGLHRPGPAPGAVGPLPGRRHGPRAPPVADLAPFPGLEAELPTGAPLDHPLFPIVWDSARLSRVDGAAGSGCVSPTATVPPDVLPPGNGRPPSRRRSGRRRSGRDHRCVSGRAGAPPATRRQSR